MRHEHSGDECWHLHPQRQTREQEQHKARHLPISKDARIMLSGRRFGMNGWKIALTSAAFSLFALSSAGLRFWFI